MEVDELLKRIEQRKRRIALNLERAKQIEASHISH